MIRVFLHKHHQKINQSGNFELPSSLEKYTDVQDRIYISQVGTSIDI